MNCFIGVLIAIVIVIVAVCSIKLSEEYQKEKNAKLVKILKQLNNFDKRIELYKKNEKGNNDGK